MEKILNQKEIDHLFQAAQGAAPKDPPAKKRAVQECDFRQAGRLSKEQVQRVTILHEPLAASLGNSLGAYLRAAFQTSFVSVEQLVYSEFLRRLPDQTYFATALVMPLDEWASIQLDLSLAFPIIDRLLGGPGHGLAETRDLTEIEEQILQSVVAVFWRELQGAWHAVWPLEFHAGQRLKKAQIMALMAAAERVLSIGFEIHLAGIRGNLNLIFPSAVSNMLLRKLAQQGIVRRRGPSAGDSARLQERLLDAKFTVQLDLPRIPVSIREIVSLQPGRVLRWRHPLNVPMSIAVNGRGIFSGAPVSCGSMRGGLIQEVKEAEPAEKERA